MHASFRSSDLAAGTDVVAVNDRCKDASGLLERLAFRELLRRGRPWLAFTPKILTAVAKDDETVLQEYLDEIENCLHSTLLCSRRLSVACPSTDPKHGTLLEAARLACITDSTECLAVLLSCGLDVDDEDFGVSLLGFSIVCGSTQAMLLLLQHGADPVYLRRKQDDDTRGCCDEATDYV